MMMGRLTIDEIIEHCKRKTKISERVFNPEILQKEDMHFGFMKEYWEHKQVAEYLEELKHFRDLKEKGKLHEFPCSLGDCLYWISDEYTDEGKPDFKIKRTQPIEAIAVKSDGFYASYDSTYDKIGSQFALLTYEDAEKKLKEMEEEYGKH